MDPGNVDQGDSYHGHRKMLCQAVSHTWAVNVGGLWLQYSRSLLSLLVNYCFIYVRQTLYMFVP